MGERQIRWGRPAPWLAAVGGACAVVYVGGWLTGILDVPNDDGSLDLILVAAVAAWGISGALIGRRRPENPIGFLLSLEACMLGALLVVDSAAKTNPGSALAAFNADAQGYVVPLILMGPFILLLFPDGRPPSRRWNPVIALFAFAALTGLIGMGLAPEREIPWSPAASLLATMSGVSATLASGLAVASVVLRFRRSRGTERAQIRWLAIVGIAGMLGLLMSLAGNAVSGSGGLLNSLGFLVWVLVLTVGLPTAIGVAVLRYRLWELDVVVKKTVVALVLTLAFGVPVLAILAISSRLLIGSDPVWTLIGGVALGLLVVPIVRLARRLATRIAFGRRASQYEVLSAFGERVGDAYSVEDVLPRMVQVLANATGATSARVLLRIGPTLREEASTGEPDGEEHTVPVRYEGEDIGALAATFPPSDPVDASKHQLMENLAAQAGLVLRNARLIEELRASRQRLVAAQDEERRKLERNIHDGAQQQLVAMSVKLRLLGQFVDRDPERAATMALELQTEATDALEDLRDLARGIYPPLLADEGLSVALRAQARKSPFPVDLNQDGIGRYPQEVEASVYFCVLEALQNVAKYARASRVEVDLKTSGDRLEFEVRDDGVGFDPETAPRGTGLQGMADRIDAVGGTLEIRTAPGRGTTIAATIPVGAPA
jgi:signal transduction histidine kinase